MRYAINNQNIRVVASQKGDKAICPNCKSTVISKCGEFKANHWAHKAIKDCDSWHEPITDWHLAWQDKFPEHCREVSLKKNNNAHRADILLNNGLVIEIQNSPINMNDIAGRESFYGDKNMIWILNGRNLLKHCSVSCRSVKQNFSLIFSIPHYIDGYGEFDDNIDDVVYDMDKFKLALFESPFLKELKVHESTIDFKESNGNHFIFQFNEDKNFDEIREYLYSLFDFTLRGFGIEVSSRTPRDTDIFPKYNWDFDVKYLRVPKDDYVYVFLHKKYWRKFIDKMSFPVFIDGLNGLDDDLIYWYQENKIIKKELLVSKYLKYA